MNALLLAVVIAATDRGVLVARSGSTEMFDRAATTVIWNSDGVPTPARIVTSNDQAAIIDSLANVVRIVDLKTGRGMTMQTGETPIDGVFVNRQLYLLERDARALERIGTDGARASISVAADPAFVRQANGRLYIYSRAAGVLQEITTAPFAVRRSATVGAFASAFEVDARNAYLVYPRAAKIGIVTMATMKESGTMPVGAVPVDLAFASSGTALTARTLAVADPSAKRVWMTEGAESFAQAVARGFLRGLIGLGLYGGHESEFPTGVDRLIVRGSRSYAYDSSTGTLYRFARSKSSVIAKSIAPQAFSVGPGGVYVWDDAVRRLQRIEKDD